MAERLTYERLLRLLQVNRSNEAVKLCQPILGLCKRQRFPEAIQQVDSAILLARNNYPIIGVVLLYSSYAQQALGEARIFELAIRDCDRAVRLLGLHKANYAIACIFRANLELDGEVYATKSRRSDDWHGRPQALGYLQRADLILQELIQEERVHNRPTRWYSVLQALVCQKMELVRASMRTGTAWAKDTSFNDNGTSKIMHIALPSDLIWPNSLSSKIEPSPLTATGNSVSHVTVNGQGYRVEVYTPIALQTGTVCWREDFQVWSLTENRQQLLVLIRPQTRPDHYQQLVAFFDNVTGKVWIDLAESSEPYSQIHIIGLDRDWRINDQVGSNPTILGSPYMLGVVEAFLDA